MKSLNNVIILMILISCQTRVFAEGLKIENTWIAEAPPVSKVLAGYMTVSNPTDEDITINSIRGDDFGSIEIHRTVHEDGIARMLYIENITIPSRGSVSFEPGSYHLMLFGKKRNLRVGDNAVLTMMTSDGLTKQISFDIKKQMSHSDHHHH